MWRCDPNRSSCTPDALPARLHCQWVLRGRPLAPAWPDDPRMAFDAAYQPIVKGNALFVGSSRGNFVVAVGIDDAAEKWRFYTNGPVRLAPVAWKDAVYVASDDGCLYCLDAVTGKLRWRFRGAPSDRRVLGNERLISMWPARGGPVVYDGPATRSGRAEVYFAAGIWPFMGVFLYALDAATGDLVWCNDGAGSVYIKQPHDSAAFGGIAPQGYIVATAERLFVPNGRAAAAAFDRHTGKLLYFDHAGNKRNGHFEAAAVGEYFINSGRVSRQRDGEQLEKVKSRASRGTGLCLPNSTVPIDYEDRTVGQAGEVGVAVGHVLYQRQREYIVASHLTASMGSYTDAEGKKRRHKMSSHRWKLPLAGKPMLCAGNRLYAGRRGEVIALELPDRTRLGAMVADLVGAPAPKPELKVCWRQKIAGTPANMIAASGRLFVTTYEGGIHCFGAEARPSPRMADLVTPAAPAPPDASRVELAREILRATGVTEGYCLVLGLTDGGLAEQLAQQSKLRVIALDADAGKVNAFRRRIEGTGLAGKRLSAVVADPLATPLPPYLASLVVSEDDETLARVPVGRLFEILRPYGGTLCAARSARSGRAFSERLAVGAGGGQLRQVGELTLLVRAGPLRGAGTWTHQYGDAANTGTSADSLVRAPLGVLWFGGPSSQGFLPCHGHGPTEQVVGGRMFLVGRSLLRALDVYTGRMLWQVKLAGVGRNYDHAGHEPGANALGTNFVATSDSVYVVHGARCLRLDVEAGKTLGQFALPKAGLAAGAPGWGYVGVWQDLLVAGASPMVFSSPDFTPDERPFGSRDGTGRLVYHSDLNTICELAAAIREWKDFKVQELEDIVPPRPKAAETGEEPPNEQAHAGDFVVSNLNRMLRDRNVLAKLPQRLVDAARAKDPERIRGWRSDRDKADEKGKRFDKPRPATIDELQAAVSEYLSASTAASPGRPDDPELRWLNQQILYRCYPVLPKPKRLRIGQRTFDHTSSGAIVVMDRRSGRALWRRKAAAAIAHNAIALGGGMLFCIDGLAPQIVKGMQRRGIRPGPATLLALDIRTGREIWRTSDGVFGTWLGYSTQHDVLLQATRPSRDMLRGERGSRLVAYQGRTGRLLWSKKTEYKGPCLLHGQMVITQGSGVDLLTGKTIHRSHPLTGKSIKWRFKRKHGCDAAVASRHLLTFRSAAAGYFDLARDGGTGNLGGFRSGCTNNLIVADGVLNAPDATRGCTCSYPNQSSLALIHMPDVEMWTFQDFSRGSEPIRRLGVNFGAPGDRLGPSGTLWLEHPDVGGRGPKIKIDVEAAGAGEVAYFRRHSLRVRGGPLAWVAASGVEGAGKIAIHLDSRTPTKKKSYTVSLHFAEPGHARAGERVFDVALQGKTVLRGLDVVAEAGKPLAPLVKTFRNVEVLSDLVIRLSPSPSARLPRPVLCGVAVRASEEAGNRTGT